MNFIINVANPLPLVKVAPEAFRFKFKFFDPLKSIEKLVPYTSVKNTTNLLNFN